MAQAAHERLCKPESLAQIAASRESVEEYLKKTFAEIGRLQEEPEFLQNVEAIQEKTHELDTWKVQREQVLAVEMCAKTCTCDENAILVLQEYNVLARRADKESGLITIPLPESTPGIAIVGVVIAMLLAAWWFARRGKRA